MTSLPVEATFPDDRLGSQVLRSRPLVLRSALLLGSAAAVFIASSSANRAALSGVEPALVVLLRGMALIKALIAMTAMGLAFWRFARPITFPAAGGVLVGVWALVGASVLIWQLDAILMAAGMFHLALFALLVIAWRDSASLRTAPATRRDY